MNGTRNESDFSRELHIIPWWAYLFGSIAFLCMQLVFHVAVARHPNPPPEGIRIFLGALTGLALGAYFMLLGYVNVDAGRRGMSRTLWTFIVILIPNGIGYIIYFLMRKPLQSTCPHCNAIVAPGTYCRKCGQRLIPLCPACQAPIIPGDTYCGACGKPTAATTT